MLSISRSTSIASQRNDSSLIMRSCFCTSFSMFEISVEEKPLFSAKEVEGSIQILAFLSVSLICICVFIKKLLDSYSKYIKDS